MAKNSKDVTVLAFIDIGWLLDGLRGQGMSWHIDYAALINHFAGDRTVTGIYGYLALYPEQYYPEKTKSQGVLLDLMREQGIETWQEEIQIRGGMYIDQGVDAKLSIDMLEMGLSNMYESAILLSRRPSLLYGVESVRNSGKRVENVFFEYTCDPSDVLSKACNEFTPLTEDLVNKFVLN